MTLTRAVIIGSLLTGCSYDESLGVEPADAATPPPDAAPVDAPPGEPDAAFASAAVVQIGGPGYDRLSQMVITGDGDLVVAGWFYGSAKFNGTEVAGAGLEDGFVARYDQTGEQQWLTLVSGAGRDRVHSVALGPGGKIAAAGSFAGEAMAGTETLSGVGGSEAFVMVLDGATGAVEWVVPYTGAGDDEARAVAFRSDRVVASGTFEESVDLAGSVETSAGMTDVFLVEHLAGGGVSWRRHYGGPGEERVYSLAVDTVYGKLLLAGGFRFGKVDFGFGEEQATATLNGILASYTTDGSPITFAFMGSSIASWPAAIVSDPTGAITAVGSGKQGGVGPSDIMLRKLTPDMSEDIIRDELGGDGVDSASGVRVDDLGRIVIAGEFSGSVSLGNAIESEGKTDALVAVLRFDGLPLFAMSVGGAGADRATAVALIDTETFAVAGTFEQSMSLNGSNLQSEGETDAFAAILAR